MLNQAEILKNWSSIKNGIRTLWVQVEEDDLENTKENIYSITPLIQERYGESKESIMEKIDSLLASFENETDLGLSPNQSSYQRNPYMSEHYQQITMPTSAAAGGAGHPPKKSPDSQEESLHEKSYDLDQEDLNYETEEIYDPDQDREDLSYDA